MPFSSNALASSKKSPNNVLPSYVKYKHPYTGCLPMYIPTAATLMFSNHTSLTKLPSFLISVTRFFLNTRAIPFSSNGSHLSNHSLKRNFPSLLIYVSFSSLFTMAISESMSKLKHVSNHVSEITFLLEMSK